MPALGRAFLGAAWTRCGSRATQVRRDAPGGGRCAAGGANWSLAGSTTRARCETDVLRHPGRPPFLQTFAGWPWEGHTDAESISAAASVVDSLPVFDVRLAHSLGRCAGAACRDAAAALDAYHELLAATSRLRTVLLRLLLPAPLLHPPSLDIMSNLSARGVDYWFWNRLHKAVHPPPAAAGDWRACSGPGVFHYSFIELWRPPCAAVAELATLMVTAQRRLARVLPLLRASSAALDVVCVAATRPRTWWPQFVSRRQPCR